MVRFPVKCILLLSLITGCQSDPPGTQQYNENILTIGEYLEINREQYSEFYRILDKGKLLITLCGYNPHGDGYTLFLPTDEAVDRFIQQSQDYGNLDEMLSDTNFIYFLTRYHTLNNSVHTDEFPDGALNDRTLTGERLTAGFYTDGENPLIKINNAVPIIRSNLEMTNGYIHVISGVLQEAENSGYDWLQQQEDYSILARAMELSGVRDRLWGKYTILAEHDSIYYRHGILSIEDLIDRVAIPGIPYSDWTNPFYQFTAYHLLNREYYLNDLLPGSRGYATYASRSVRIEVGLEIRIDPGVDTFGIEISGSGDTTVIAYILPVWGDCNIMTQTGPVHSISELLTGGSLSEGDFRN